MWRLAVLLLCAGAISTVRAQNSRIVNITQGAVRGYLVPAGGVYAFYDIPYATAPTGVDRYKAPLPPPVWMQTFDAVNRFIVCLQPSNFPNMREDCLVTSVFVPDTNEVNLPVLVLFHGGGYQVGFGNMAPTQALVRLRNIIVVTFNYRLGPHGFLCLGTERAPGNAGLKDQLALLRWVQTNIASFGGNPNDVTISGCSAAGGSVDIMTISPATAGLFQRASVESGAVIGAVGLQNDPLANAQRYANLLNFTNVEDLEALGEFYTTISFQHLLSRDDAIINNEDAEVLFSPCIERYEGEEMILNDAPINIIRQGRYNRIPLLYGFANMEGLLRIRFFDSWIVGMNNNFADFLPADLQFESEEEKNEVAQTVREFYFGNQTVSEENVLIFINYFTDVLFGYPMLKVLSERIQSLNDTMYLYEYSFVDENSPSIPHTNERGADHCDQMIAVLDQNESTITEEYRRMKAIMREYWLNFITTGAPSVQGSDLIDWPPAAANRDPYMSLGRTVELRNGLLAERAALWDDIYGKYYRAPIPPTHASSAISLMISNIIIASTIMLLYLCQ